MDLDAKIQLCLDRWYPLKDHPVQLDLITAVDRGVRFPVVPAGRRSGKTERFKRKIVKAATAEPGMYFAAAPTRDQAKKIFWKDLKLFTFEPAHSKRASESDLIIFMPNGSEIHVVGLDKPSRIEGTPWIGGGIDEIADIKKTAWQENIYPALNTEDPSRVGLKTWCWLLGVPDGLNHYYDLAEYAEHSEDPEWGLFHWKSADILSKSAIEAAKRFLSPMQFRQEYEASFENASGRIYADYSKENKTSERIEKHEQLLWHHDFNYTPLSSGIGVTRDKGTFILDEIVLQSAVARQSALEFCEKFKDHDNRKVIIYGDPSGRAGEKHGHESDYSNIKEVLVQNDWAYEMRLKKKHPAIKDRQNAVRARICNASMERHLFVNPTTAATVDKGLARVQLKDGSTFLEEDSEFQHITTAVGYMIDYDYPVIGRKLKQRVARGAM